MRETARLGKSEFDSEHQDGDLYSALGGALTWAIARPKMNGAWGNPSL